MTTEKPPFLTRYAEHLPLGAGILGILVGLLVFIGWTFNITLFKSLHPSLVTIKPNAAVCFFLSGLSLVLLAQRERDQLNKIIEKMFPVLALVVIAIGLLTLSEYILQRSLGIDQIFFQERPGAVETYVPGRMSPLAAGSFLLLGFSHLLAYRYRYWSSQFISVIVILFGVTALFGYVFQVESLYSPGPYTSIGLHSAVAFLTLGVGTISLFPTQSFIKTIFQDDIGGFVARRLLPAALILPLFLGLIALAGQRMQFYGSNATTLLITISIVVIFTIIIFSNARLLSLIEYERKKTERAGQEQVERVQQRLSFLAKASRILARSLDYELTLSRIARLSTPYVSDWCAIDLVQEDGRVKRVTIKHIDDSKNKILEQLGEQYPRPPDSGRGVYKVLETGESELLPDIPDVLLQEVAEDETHLRLMRALGLRSIIIVPLKGREEVFGAITLATAESNRRFTEEDLVLAEELARRAAMAIEKAQLFEETKKQKDLLEIRVRERTTELEATNLELRNEIVERKRAEAELRGSEDTLAALVRTASKLITLLDVSKVYEIICQETARVLNVPICNIRLFDRSKTRLNFISGFGLERDFWERLKSPTDQYQRFKSRGRDHQLNMTADVQALTDSPNYALFKEYDIRTTVGVSLIIEDELIGRLTVGTTGESRKFSENELVLLKGLADQAALAIQNAQLLDQVRRGQERLRRLTRQLVSAQEGERRRISRELHDEAGQSLTAMKINLMLLKDILPPSEDRLREQLGDLSALADDIMERLRMLAHDLRPPALETLGLNKTLEGLCRQFANRTNISIHYAGTEIHSLPEEATITIYRLVQEALTNIAKHANADQVSVKLEEWNAIVTILIKDNGQGFTIEGLDRVKSSFDGMGLSGMQERLESVGGQLEIYSKPNKGTEIVASIPLAT